MALGDVLLPGDAAGEEHGEAVAVAVPLLLPDLARPHLALVEIKDHDGAAGCRAGRVGEQALAVFWELLPLQWRQLDPVAVLGAP